MENRGLTSVAVSDLDDGTDGEVITWDAAGEPTTVAVGTAGQILTSNGPGAAPTFQTGSGGATEFTDTQFSVLGSADATKKFKFEVDGITTGTTRTMTVQDSDDTLVGRATTDTLTNKTIDANGTGNSISNIDVEDLANGTDGELITWDAAGAPATVGAGTSGQVLTSNGAGAAPTFASAPSGMITSENLADEGTIALDTGKTGWVTVMAGDNEEFALATFTAAGVVSLVHWTANAINTDTDGYLCIYDGGSGVVIKNRLGTAKDIRYLPNYSA